MTELAAQKPDWLLWLYKSKVALWECVCLSLDFEPDFVNPALQFPETQRRMAVLRKHVGARSKLLPPPRGYAWTGDDDSIHQAIDLCHFVKWAKLQGWLIPKELAAGSTLASSVSDVLPVEATAAESLIIEMRLHREAIEHANQARERERVLATMSEIARRTIANANRMKSAADTALATRLADPGAQASVVTHRDETPGARRDRIQARVDYFKGQGLRDFTRRVAAEEGISTDMVRKLLRARKKRPTQKAVKRQPATFCSGLESPAKRLR